MDPATLAAIAFPSALSAIGVGAYLLSTPAAQPSSPAAQPSSPAADCPISNNERSPLPKATTLDIDESKKEAPVPADDVADDGGPQVRVARALVSASSSPVSDFFAPPVLLRPFLGADRRKCGHFSRNAVV
jgi:hypothetical protein